MAKNDKGGSFVTGFLVGGIIGAIAGIILAPKSGIDTRHGLTERSENLRSRAEVMAANVRGQIGPAVDSARGRVGPAVDNVRGRIDPAIENVRERVNPIVDQVTSRIGRAGSADDAATEENGVAERTGSAEESA